VFKDTSLSCASQEREWRSRIVQFLSRQTLRVSLLVALLLALGGSLAPLPSVAVTAGAPVAVHPDPWGCGNSSGWC